jgi:hypothetical protein
MGMINSSWTLILESYFSGAERPTIMLSFLRKARPYLIVAVLIAAAYDGWIFYSRWRDRRSNLAAHQVAEATDARKTIELLGGGQLKILAFYPATTVIHPGERTNLCYGVYGAKSVRIDPPVETLYPAVEHCFQVSPSKTTEYTLIAEDGSGHQATQTTQLRVAGH